MPLCRPAVWPARPLSAPVPLLRDRSNLRFCAFVCIVSFASTSPTAKVNGQRWKEAPEAPALLAVRGRETPVAPAPTPGGLAQLLQTTLTSTNLVGQEVGRTTHLRHRQPRTKIETRGGTRQLCLMKVRWSVAMVCIHECMVCSIQTERVDFIDFT